jgi:hypothetical protein
MTGPVTGITALKSERAKRYLAERKHNKGTAMNTPEENAAIATCNSWLNVFGLPTYTQLQERIAELEAQLAASVAAQEMRFYMDHGLWHDRETGQHMWTQDQYDEESRSQYLAGAEDQANGIAHLRMQPAPSEHQPEDDPLICKDCGMHMDEHEFGVPRFFCPAPMKAPPPANFCASCHTLGECGNSGKCRHGYFEE